MGRKREEERERYQSKVKDIRGEKWKWRKTSGFLSRVHKYFLFYKIIAPFLRFISLWNQSNQKKAS